VSDLIDYCAGHCFPRGSVGGEQCSVADDIDEPRDTAGIERDALDRIRSEEVSAFAAGHPESVMNERADFLVLEP
jgi:hypothetical protein